MSDPVPDLLKLLGPAVLLGWPRGTKGTEMKWKHLRLADMTPGYLSKLQHGNIGVALGEKSLGLCAIDIDRDELVEPFLAANPSLRDTPQTHGARGRVFWVRCIGDYPKRTIKLKMQTGEAVGEFRSNGSQSIIAGIHPDTRRPYEIVHKAKPVEINFRALVWPEGIVPPETGSEMQRRRTQTNPSASCVLDGCVPASLGDCVPASLHNTTGRVLDHIVARAEAQKALMARQPALSKLYAELIEPRFQARPRHRNGFITDAVPFLYRAVAASFVLNLVGHFYDCNRSLFNDPRDQHMREAQAMLKGVKESYLVSLSADERQIYAALTEREQDAFRICRDLSLLPELEREPLTFFLSYGHLADRIGIRPMQAQRTMRQLEIYGLIRLVTKGTRRAPGVQGKAGVYRWQLPPPLRRDPKP